jgi:hypothetical protein
VLILDPIVRSQLAELEWMIEVNRLLAYEGLSNATHRKAPAFGGALGVVVAKENQLRFAQIITEIVGPLAQIRTGSRWAPIDGGPEAWYRWSFANHAGGTSQVKRMVLATRGLGLPR